MGKLTAVFSLQAENELDIAFNFYDSISPKIGDAFLYQINECVKSILINPETYKIEFEIYRQAAVKKFPFVIIYTQIDDIIFVSSIFHTSQNPNKKFK
jgi:hypothetical protein